MHILLSPPRPQLEADPCKHEVFRWKGHRFPKGLGGGGGGCHERVAAGSVAQCLFPSAREEGHAYTTQLGYPILNLLSKLALYAYYIY